MTELTSQAAREKQWGVQRGGGVESVVELVLSVCYTQSGGFGVWFSYFT